MGRGQTSHEFSGVKPKERAMAILDTYDEEVVDNIKIEIEESFNDTTSEDSSSEVEPEDDTETESNTENEGENKAESEADEEQEQEEGEERYLGEISSGTNHQKVLYAIQKLDHEAPVEATRIEEWVVENTDFELKRGSIFGALHDLFERRLIDRQKNDQHNNEYQITVHGDDQLQKVGEP
jgi:hypothetical protein